MLALLTQNLRHVIRAKILWFVVFFAIISQFLGIKLLNLIMEVMKANAALEGLGSAEMQRSIFLLVMLQLIGGSMIAWVYGIWFVPYLHQMPRVFLFFTLPVSRWRFVAGYSLTLLVLLAFQLLTMFVLYLLLMGTSGLAGPQFPWASFAVCLVWEVLVFHVLMFGVGVCCLVFGKAITFLISSGGLFVLQVLAVYYKAIEKTGVVLQEGAVSVLLRKIYSVLPPGGELMMDLVEQFNHPSVSNLNLWKWVAWLVIFVVSFRFVLDYPLRAKEVE